MLSRALSASVPAGVRSRGHQYFSTGRVVSLEGDASFVRAVVRGEQDYHVRITREESEFTAACDCPYFADRADPCKHVWAVVLAAESRGLLAASDEPPARAWMTVEFDTDPATLHRPRSTEARPPAWQRILDDVRQGLSRAPQPLGRFASRQIIYAIESAPGPASTDPVLRLLSRHRKKSGDWSRPKPLSISAHELEQLPAEADREILSLVAGAGFEFGYQSAYSDVLYPGRSAFRLPGPLARRVLPLAAQTGRLFVALGDNAPLEPVAWDEGGAWRFELLVSRSADGEIGVDGTLTRGASTMPLTEPQLVLSAGFLVARSRLSRLNHGEAFVWFPHLRRMGQLTLPPEAATSLIEVLARSGAAPERLPPDLRYDVYEGEPRPSIRVMRADSRYLSREKLRAVFQFDYDGTLIDANAPGPSYDAERRRVIRRHAEAEATAARRLQELGFHHLFDHELAAQVFVVDVDQFPRAVRVLVQEGWRVEAEGRVFRGARGLQVHVASGVDWFELHGRVDFGDGIEVPLPELLAALERGDGTITLGDGTRGLVPEEWLRRYAGITRFGQAAGDHVRFRPSQAALLDALLAAQPSVSVDEAFARARAALKTFDGIRPADPPATFRGELREYQREALGWFEFLRRFGFGGCLADDMGLGKTVMVLAMLAGRAARADRRPSLAVVPRSLVFNWIEEAQRFVPVLRILDYTGTSRDLQQVGEHDLILTTYGTLRRDAVLLQDVALDYVILDEAQAIKNASTAAARAVRLLASRHRLALSGTPIENHLGELWSLFEFLNPGLLGSAAAFADATAGRARLDRENLAVVARAVRPFILRRTKQQVAPELPARSEQTIHCELEGAQRRLYDQLRDHYRRSLLARIARDGLNRSRLQVLEALLRLRQAACHPALIDKKRHHEPSAKLDILLPHLMEVIEEGHKALVFSQFTSFLAILRERLESDGVPYAYLDGRTRDRAERVARFRDDPGCQLFLISLKAGGLGLNLIQAEYVFLLDPWWNPAVEAQAIDRAHRIGQTERVFAYRLIARDTVEEKVADLQQTKRELADAILSSDAGPLRDLQPEDLEWLLS